MSRFEIETVGYEEVLERAADRVGARPIGSIDVGYYQGDIYQFVRMGDLYGVMVIGYGSCSGCDTLEYAADYSKSQEEYDVQIEELVRDTANDVRWFDSLDGLKAYYTDETNRGYGWYHNEQEFLDFISNLKDESGPAS